MKKRARIPLLAGLTALVLGALASAAPPPTINPRTPGLPQEANDAALADPGAPVSRADVRGPLRPRIQRRDQGRAGEALLPRHLEPPAGSPYADFNANSARRSRTAATPAWASTRVDKLAKAQAKFCA